MQLIAPLPKSIATVSLSGTLAEKMEAAAAIGFDGVEIFENDLLTSEDSPAEIRYLRAIGADFITHAFELVAAGDGEPARERFLVGSEHVHGEDFALVEAWIALGFLVDTDQQQRRNQRDRGERVGGQAMHLARAAN